MIDKQKIEINIGAILTAIGENPEREGLVETPRRVAEAYAELLRGYEEPSDHMKKTFSSKYTGILLRAGTPAISLCEHHLFPYLLRVDFAYLPNKRILGLSKITRLIQHFSARLSVQEELTDYIIDKFVGILEPKGAMIILTGHHTCEMYRGIKTEVPTITSAIRGDFMTNPSLKAEALELIKMTRNGKC